MPPAVQTEIRPRPEPFSLSNFAIDATILAPVAANGWCMTEVFLVSEASRFAIQL